MLSTWQMHLCYGATCLLDPGILEVFLKVLHEATEISILVTDGGHLEKGLNGAFHVFFGA